MDASPCHAVLLTPPGRGAVATVLVAGERAVSIVDRRFAAASNKPLADCEVGRTVFGRWRNTEYSESAGEEIVVCRTADDEIEIHCHGGSAASRAIIGTLVADGCVECDWSDWQRATARDTIAADAQIALAAATTMKAATILLDQFHGALRRELELSIAACETGDSSLAMKLLQRLEAFGRLGLHLTTPHRVVLAGRPNVGKSSLMNAILGYTRAIVFDEPGTTRDVVTATTAIDGWPVELSDTAGLRVSRDAIETEGVARARHAAAEADLLVLVFETAPPWDDDELALVDAYPSAILVINKSDQHRSVDMPANAFATSALTGEGIARLIQAIGERLVPRPPQPGDAVPFTGPQVDAIVHSLRLANNGDLSRAAETLRGLLS